MKTKLLLIALLVTNFVNAQLATFANTQAQSVSTNSAMVLTIITTPNTATVYCQVGTSSNPANLDLAPLQSAGSSSAGTFVNTKNLLGLLEDTVYYYRFRADNNAGTSYSPILSFRTVSTAITAPTVSNLNATNIQATGATINYTLNANNAFTTSIVKYGLAPGNLLSTVGGSTASGFSNTAGNAQITGLNPNTNYYYQIEATNSAGTTVSTIGTFNTAPTPVTFDSLNALLITATTARLNVYIDNICPSATQFRLQYSKSSDFTTNTVDNPYTFGGAGTRSIDISGLTPNTIYYFRYYVPANGACNTTQVTSVSASFTTGLPLPSIPAINVTLITTNSAQINYNLNANNAATTSIVRYGTTMGNLSSSITGFTASGNTVTGGNVPITGLSTSTQYFYKIEATNSGGTTTSATLNFTTASPAVTFDNLTATLITATTARLNVDIANICLSSTQFRLQYSKSSDFTTNTTDTAHTFGGPGTRSIDISGLTPNTLYYFRYYVPANGSCNASQVTSVAASFTTATAFPVISAISSAIGTNYAIINYTLNANSLATSSVVKYGLTSTNLSSQVSGSGASGLINTPGGSTIVGLLPSTQYFYKIEATNTAGTTPSAILSFTTTAFVPSVIEYNFNNTYNNINGTMPFASNAGTGFTTDRNNVGLRALNISSTGSSAVIPNLPYGNAARTVSLWVKFITLESIFNYVYHYGANGSGNGAYLNAYGILYFANPASQEGSTTIAVNTWYHIVISYDGTNSKIYRNGTLLSSEAKTINTSPAVQTNANLFRLGLTESGVPGYFNGAIDDLKIYNYAVTSADVTSLYTNNTLSSENFNQNNLEVALFPNPANDVLNIEMTSELKSIEIYNIQGQKVKSATQKQINVSDLAAGIYMIKIQDSENEIATKKFVKR